jgi:hypothetical protein
MARSSLLSFVACAVFAAGLVGCGSSGFVSDDPTWTPPNPAAQPGPSVGADGGASAAPPPTSGATPSDPGEAARAIEEADVVQVDGTRVFALSRTGGLVVVDASNPSALRVLSRVRVGGEPFEMYLENGTAYVMLTHYGRWVGPSSSGKWEQTSEILAYDVRDPSRPKEIASFDVPGDIADSRLVGDVLYLVTYESGSCWRCEARPSTTVTSFKLAAPVIAQVDQLRFSSDSGYPSWRRSVMVTPKRLYVAGPEWGSFSPQRSVVQIVDISSPQGKLVKGADVLVAGSIESRWQLDEHQGVLRVISQQWPEWRAIRNPRVETFTVASSFDVQPLGGADLVLRKPESLRSVRFDGPRAYAITAERTDPLFTIDLSDPARPKPMGELEIPGWVYHMEPRGDRLLGVGFDNQNPAGSLNVSLFDVSDLAAPKMLKRVSFAEGWGNLPEDQDRIHKAFRVFDDKGLVVVPFASYGRWNGSSCSAPESGIQLVDVSHDDLVLRGVAPQRGQPRRALFVGDALLAMSDRNVTAFDVADRAAPKKLSEVDLVAPAHAVLSLGSNVAVLSNDWWSGEPTLSIVPRDALDVAAPIGRISLADVFGSLGQLNCGYGGWSAYYGAEMLRQGDVLWLVVWRTSDVYGYGYPYSVPSATTALLVAGLDVSDPSRPRLVGRTKVDLGAWPGWLVHGDGVVMSGSWVVAVDGAIAVLENVPAPSSRGSGLYGVSQDVPALRVEKRRVHVVDVRDPAHPAVRATVDLVGSRSALPMVASGRVLYASYFVPEGGEGKARFFVDRIDLSDPSAPRALSAINVPGSLLAVQGDDLVLVDYERRSSAGSECAPVFLGVESRPCSKMHRTLKRVRLAPTGATVTAVGSEVGMQVRVTDRRILDLGEPSYDMHPSGGYAYRPGALRVLDLGGDLRTPIATFAGADALVAAKDTRLALARSSGLEIWDTVGGAARQIGELPLRNWGYAWDVAFEDGFVIVAQGEQGARLLPLQ